jgi:hypothetical protein
MNALIRGFGSRRRSVRRLVPPWAGLRPDSLAAHRESADHEVIDCHDEPEGLS